MCRGKRARMLTTPTYKVFFGIRQNETTTKVFFGIRQKETTTAILWGLALVPGFLYGEKRDDYPFQHSHAPIKSA
jgi:hypothetical protein